MNGANRKEQKPTGFLAQCECGACLGAVDFTLTEPETSLRILSSWLEKGARIIPQFGDGWPVYINPCLCGTLSADRRKQFHGLADEWHFCNSNGLKALAAHSLKQIEELVARCSEG